MNIAVINVRDIIKYFVCFVFIILVILIGISALKKEEFDKEVEETSTSFFEGLKNSSFLYCLKMEIPLIAIEDANNSKGENNFGKSNKILDSELALMYSLKEYEETEDIKKEEEVKVAEDEEQITDEEKIDVEDEEHEQHEEVADNLHTEVMSEHNIKETYTNEGRSVKVNNQTNFDVNDIINNSNYEIKNKDKIIIYHTHTCESYTSSDAYNYNMTGNYRTTDLNFTVSRVGDELEKWMKEYGKTVIHDKTFHDYPEYNGSYSRSLKTMKSVLGNNGDAEIAIDLHRDAVGSSNSYGPTVKIGDDMCAQVMFVIGTNGSGLYHPDWKKNLSYAVKVQEKANEMYPGFFRPIILRNSRYNQHMTTATTIIEVGATGNTLEQCLNSMKYLSKVLAEVTK